MTDLLSNRPTDAVVAALIASRNADSECNIRQILEDAADPFVPDSNPGTQPLPSITGLICPHCSSDRCMGKLPGSICENLEREPFYLR